MEPASPLPLPSMNRVAARTMPSSPDVSTSRSVHWNAFTDTGAVDERIARVENHAGAVREPCGHFRGLTCLTSQLDDGPTRTACVHHVHGPLFAVTEQRARRHFHHIRGFPDHDTHLHPIAVAER